MIITLLAIVLSTVSFDRQAAVEAHAEARENLSVTPPKPVLKPDTSGYVLSVLAENDTAPYFADTENSPKNVQKRNFHLALESGAVIGTSSVPAIYDAAKNDILSGTYAYDVYAASGRELSRLLSYALLDDISDNPYIDTSEKWFDSVITDSLGLFDGKYMLSSTLTDAYEHAYVLAYNRALVDEAELIGAALDGTFTIEKLISYKKGAEIGQSDIFPLYVSAGGGFVGGGEDLSIVSLDEFEKAVNRLMPLIELPVGRFADESAVFATMTVEEVKKYKAEGMDIGILPLPKQSENDDYRCYIDIGNTPLIAFPRDHSDIEVISYLVYRMAFLSYGYVIESCYENFSEYETDVLRLIAKSGVTDITDLFGYGDVDELVTDAFFGREKRLSLEYYNRKTLYEKALEIIETRINKENQK